MSYRLKNIILLLIISFFCLMDIDPHKHFLVASPHALLVAPANAADKTASQQKAEGTAVIAYYFHGNFRCAKCRAIEQLSREAIRMNFKEQLESGKLTFLVINVDEPENEHFIKDYQLVTRSLVITQLKSGKQVSWKNLSKVWNYVRDEQAFYSYVKSEVQGYLN